MYKAVIFDVDGTLLNGTDGIIKSIKTSLKHFNLPELTESQLLNFVGPPIQNSCKEYLNMNEKQAQDFANYFRKEYAKGDVFLATAYDGIYELLELLKNANFKLGVATYKRQDYTTSLMKHFGFDKYFVSMCGADNENKLKKSDIIQNCTAELGIEKSEAIMIGDSYHDAEAAEKIGIAFIGVTYGFGFKSKNDITQYNPIFCADEVNEIIDWLKISLLSEVEKHFIKSVKETQKLLEKKNK